VFFFISPSNWSKISEKKKQEKNRQKSTMTQIVKTHKLDWEISLGESVCSVLQPEKPRKERMERGLYLFYYCTEDNGLMVGPVIP
jgi:hypothetical protein